MNDFLILTVFVRQQVDTALIVKPRFTFDLYMVVAEHWLLVLGDEA